MTAALIPVSPMELSVLAPRVPESLANIFSAEDVVGAACMGGVGA